MKLAEALLLRSEYQKQIESLRERLYANLKVQEGESPAEDPQELLKELDQVLEQLGALIQKINAANNRAVLADGRTVSQALVDRDILLRKRNVLSSVAEQSSQQDYRLTRTEIKMKSTLSVKELQTSIDRLAKEFRVLDTEIQGINWTTSLETA